jgi:regulator of protease activity HflC (stomatin/prohibitin superfamily)
MKNRLLIFVLGLFIFASCTSVESGHKGVRVEWGGATDTTQVYPEGMHTGISWLWDDMIEYDVRENTTVMNLAFNDKNDMLTNIQVAVDWNLDASMVNLFHKEVKDIQVKIEKSISSAAKEVVPQYGAVDLNKNSRSEAEKKLESILRDEFASFYAQFKRVNFTDIDIPEGISKLAEETAVQIGRNQLAEKKEAEQIALAKAKVAEAQGNYEAELLNDKTKALQSKPQYLELFNAQTNRIWAEKGVSPWGTNNVFGTSSTSVIKGLGN